MEKVLTGILYVLTEGCRWRAIDEPEASWNSIYHYYRRWCQSGVWQKLWEQVAPNAKPSKTVYGDASFIKVHGCGLNAAHGRQAQAIGLTKGGWNTKLHAAVDARGQPVALLLTGGEVAEVSQAEELLENIETQLAVLDKGYDSDRLRDWLRDRGITPCIPFKRNRKNPGSYSRAKYRKRHLIENFFAKIKVFRRVATRYDKLAVTFFGWVMLAVILKCGR